MDPTATLRQHIAQFPGYEEEAGRRLADELVRSFLGEALAAMRDRLEPLSSDLETKIDDTIVRTGFANQRAFRPYEEGARLAKDFGAMAQADAAVVELADRSVSIDQAGLAGYLGEANAALDRRDEVMASYGSGGPPPVTATLA